MRFEFDCSPSALSHLFDTTFIRPGMSREVPGGATIRLQEFPMQHRDLPAIHASLITVLIYCGTALSSVALSVLSNWIYEQLTRGRTGRRTMIRVEGLLIEVTPEAIARLFAESVEIEVEK